jgi:hypothetical protein
VTVDGSLMVDRLRRHYEELGGKPATAADIYAEDAVLEYANTGERLRGRANIAAAHDAYPGRPASFEVRRAVCVDDLAVVEMTLRFAGTDPHPVVAILDLRDDLVIRERRYIAEPDEPAAYRAQWVEPAGS